MKFCIITKYLVRKLFAAIVSFLCSAKCLHIPQELRIRSGGTERHSASN